MDDLRKLIKPYYSDSQKRCLLYAILSEVFEDEFYDVEEDEFSVCNEIVTVVIRANGISKAQEIANWVVATKAFSLCLVDVSGFAFAESTIENKHS